MPSLKKDETQKKDDRNELFPTAKPEESPFEPSRPDRPLLPEASEPRPNLEPEDDLNTPSGEHSTSRPNPNLDSGSNEEPGNEQAKYRKAFDQMTRGALEIGVAAAAIVAAPVVASGIGLVGVIGATAGLAVGAFDVGMGAATLSDAVAKTAKQEAAKTALDIVSGPGALIGAASTVGTDHFKAGIAAGQAVDTAASVSAMRKNLADREYKQFPANSLIVSH